MGQIRSRHLQLNIFSRARNTELNAEAMLRLRGKFLPLALGFLLAAAGFIAAQIDQADAAEARWQREWPNTCVYRKLDSAENGPESVGVVGSAHAAGRS